MASQDLYIKNKIEKILNNGNINKLILYFDHLPIKNIRRNLSILSEIFPDKLIISDNYFDFIKYILINDKFLKVQSISSFIRAINIIKFNDIQKNYLSDLILSKINLLSKYCDFELNMLIINIFKPKDFMKRLFLYKIYLMMMQKLFIKFYFI
ncbi:hypothetical protein [Neisseria zalophi]|uniref:Uncharacterized protein n=1 Tax=Neisseria zalophi TaxID=640030 RepID=A0A5J6PV82_9NEIS|nr:hypothetical protein [Neisseria zalophi]QEY26186.1 hypothetical protein D0T92_06385 [Neisseria zalophi]